jgi:hypothetical protein
MQSRRVDLYPQLYRAVEAARAAKGYTRARQWHLERTSAMRAWMQWLIAERPWRFTATLCIGWLAIGLMTALALPHVFPSIDTTSVRALGQIALALVAALLAARGGWHVVEPQGGRVRAARLLIAPVLIAALPLAAGLRIESWSLVAFLVVMELVVGFSEELVFRGLMLRALLPGGATRAVLVSSALFGLVHLANIIYGVSVVVTLLQVLGAFVFGVGMAAIVLRGGALWPAMLIHALANAALRFSWLVPQPVPTPLMSALVSTLLLIYGVILLRRPPLAAPTRSASAQRLGL